MLTKTTIALATFLVIGFGATALAAGPDGYYADGTWIRPAASQATDAYAFAGTIVPQTVKPFTAAERALFERVSPDVMTR